VVIQEEIEEGEIVMKYVDKIYKTEALPQLTNNKERK
jgi:hypothetical protein